MSKDSKRFKEAKKAVDPLRLYSPLEAVRLLKGLETANFDETVEVHIKLGINPRHADQQVRGTMMLPHGTGKTLRVAVFAKGDKATEARKPAPTSWAPRTWPRGSRTASWTSTRPWPLPT